MTELRCTFQPGPSPLTHQCWAVAVCLVDVYGVEPYPRCARCLSLMLESWSKGDGLLGAVKFAQRVRDLNGNPVDIAEVLGSNTLPFTED